MTDRYRPVPDKRHSYFIPAMAPVYSGLSNFAEFALRVVVGLNLIPHGLQKLFGGLGGTAQFLDASGFSPGFLWAVLVMATELVGGVFLILGFATRPAALAVMLFMIVAAFFHSANGFLWDQGGFEYPLMWAVAAFYFLVRGGGPWSIDRRIGREF